MPRTRPISVLAIAALATTATGCDLALLSDAFDEPATLDTWLVRAEREQDVPHHDWIAIDTETPGHLTIDATDYDDPSLTDAGAGAAWYQSRRGPMLYRIVRGDFIATAHVRVGTVADIDVAPLGGFNSGGFLVRDPASHDPDALDDHGGESWLMYNIGNQAGFWGSETKTTFPDGPDLDAESQSTLFLTPVGELAGRLRVCRVGDAFRFFRSLDADGGAWTEEAMTWDNLASNGAGLPGDDFHAEGFVRRDFPAEVQVGLVANRWNDGPGSPVRVEFDFVSFRRPGPGGDCLPD